MTKNGKDIICSRINDMTQTFYEGGMRPSITFYVILSRNCNGGCEYCYQDKSFRTTDMMTPKIIDDIVRFALSKFKENEVLLYFFGGEPTMNWELIKYTLEKYPQLKFHMTTNGIVLSGSQEKRDFIKKHAYHLSLSVSVEPLIRLFGPDEFMEKARPLLDLLTTMNADTHMVLSDVEPWFERIFKEQLEMGVKRVRVSTVKCSDKLNDKIEEVSEIMYKLIDYIYFTGEPKFGRSSFDYYLMSNITNKMIGRAVKDVPPTLCGAGYSYVAIDTQGDIYPCDMFASLKALKMGTIYTGFDITSSIFLQKDEWRNEIYEDCANCKIVDDFRLCPRAMCLAENFQQHGSPFKPSENHCRLNEIDVRVNEYLVKKAMDLGCVGRFCKQAQDWHKINMGVGKEKYGLEEQFGLAYL
jgi:uncharacterized protein